MGAEPGSTFRFPASGALPTEIESIGTKCKRAGWVEGRARERAAHLRAGGRIAFLDRKRGRRADRRDRRPGVDPSLQRTSQGVSSRRHTGRGRLLGAQAGLAGRD